MKDGNLDQYVAEFNRLSHLADRNNKTRGLIPLFRQGLPYGLAQACMNRSKWPETIHQWQAVAREENKRYAIKKNLGLARSPKEGKDRKQQWKAALKGKQRDGQLCSYGGGRSPNPTTPYQTSRETKEGRAMLPLRSTRPHVQGMPQKAPQTPSLHQSTDSHHPTDKCYHHCRSDHLPNRDRRGKGQPPGSRTKRIKRRRSG